MHCQRDVDGRKAEGEEIAEERGGELNRLDVP